MDRVLHTEDPDPVERAVSGSPVDGSSHPVVSVVLPCLNEEASVGLCVTEAMESLARSGILGEVVVVDNGSTDASTDVARAAGARVVHDRRKGYGSALRSGFEAPPSARSSSWPTQTRPTN